MNTSTDEPIRARFDDGRIAVILRSGLEVRFPIVGNSRLEGQGEEKLNNNGVLPFGVHWPDLDEDLSVRGILKGSFGQREGELGTSL